MIDLKQLRSDVIDLRLSGAKPRVHGNGFIQLDLDAKGTTRLHVFAVTVPRQATPTPIHDHVFDMRSHVLCGTLIHEELRAEPVEVGTHRIYRARQVEGTQNTILEPDTGEVLLNVEQRLVLLPGSIYTFPAFHLHQTGHRGLTATVMQKENPETLRDYGRPRVLCSIYEEPDNDFHRDAHEPGPLWELIAAALNKADLYYALRPYNNRLTGIPL